MEDQYVFTETKVPGAEISSSQRATPEQLVDLANAIWGRVKNSGVAEDDDEGNDTLLETLQGDFKDFNTSFPLILRWMVQMRKFSPAALKKYLMKHSATKLDTRESFLELQAEYLVLLYREEHRHPDENFVKRYRTNLVKTLLEEDKAFADMQKQVEEDLATQAAVIDTDRRKQLYEYLLARKIQNEVVVVKSGDATEQGDTKQDEPLNTEVD